MATAKFLIPEIGGLEPLAIYNLANLSDHERVALADL